MPDLIISTASTKAFATTSKTLRNRVERVISIKEQLGLFDKIKKVKVDKKKFESSSRAMVDKSITLIRDRNNILPFKINKNTKILHLILSNNYENEIDLYKKFTREMRKSTKKVKEMINPGHGL